MKAELKRWVILIAIVLVILIIMIGVNYLIIHTTKKSKIITIKKITPFYSINRKRISSAIRPSYVIQDENGDYYMYKYSGITQWIGGYKTLDYQKIAALKSGDRVEVIYYGFGMITHSLLDVNRI